VPSRATWGNLGSSKRGRLSSWEKSEGRLCSEKAGRLDGEVTHPESCSACIVWLGLLLCPPHQCCVHSTSLSWSGGVSDLHVSICFCSHLPWGFFLGSSGFRPSSPVHLNRTLSYILRWPPSPPPGNAAICPGLQSSVPSSTVFLLFIIYFPGLCPILTIHSSSWVFLRAGVLAILL
jgi:hypothetical protein